MYTNLEKGFWCGFVFSAGLVIGGLVERHYHKPIRAMVVKKYEDSTTAVPEKRLLIETLAGDHFLLPAERGVEDRYVSVETIDEKVNSEK